MEQMWRWCGSAALWTPAILSQVSSDRVSQIKLYLLAFWGVSFYSALMFALSVCNWKTSDFAVLQTRMMLEVRPTLFRIFQEHKSVIAGLWCRSSDGIFIYFFSLECNLIGVSGVETLVKASWTCPSLQVIRCSFCRLFCHNLISFHFDINAL